LARLTQETIFFGACQRLLAAQDKQKAKQFKETDHFVAYDTTVHVKEFRERPAAKFFGDLLADDTVRASVTTALVNAVDPATRAAAAEKEAAALLTQRIAYEAALLDAQKAILDFQMAKEEDRALKQLDMEYKKRAANRLADALKLPRPYPESGTWFTG